MSIRDDLARLARHAVGDYRYERFYPCQVVRSYDGGAVDVLPDDDVVRGIGLQSVPAASVAPATFARAEPGCRCLLTFRSGDPRQPAITAWEYAEDSATVYLDGGVAAVARKGDLVDVYLSNVGPSFSPIRGIVSGEVTTPGSPPTVTPVAAVQFTGTASISTPVRGVIIGGAPKIKA